MREQDVDQLPGTLPRELDVPQGEAHPAHRVVAQPPHLGQVRARPGHRIPGAARGVLGQVLDGVQQMREPPEEPPRLRQRRDVAGPPGQYGRMPEGRAGRRLRRLGDLQ